jgi:hypothetical protein
MKVAGAVLCAAALLLASIPAHADKAEKQIVGAELTQLDHSDTSPALRDMKPIAPDWAELAEDEHEVKTWAHHHPPRKLGAEPDVLAELARSLAPAPSITTTLGPNFDGVGNGNYAVASAPPDTVGAVGTTQYVQWVNTAFAVFNKTTGATVYGPVAGKTLWQGFGGRCETDNNGDPLVMFDKLAIRRVGRPLLPVHRGLHHG